MKLANQRKENINFEEALNLLREYVNFTTMVVDVFRNKTEKSTKKIKKKEGAFAPS